MELVHMMNQQWIYCFDLHVFELKVNLRKRQISISTSNSEVWRECGEHHLIPSPPLREVGPDPPAAVWLTRFKSHPHRRCGLPIVMTTYLVPCLCLCPKDWVICGQGPRDAHGDRGFNSLEHFGASWVFLFWEHLCTVGPGCWGCRCQFYESDVTC